MEDCLTPSSYNDRALTDRVAIVTGAASGVGRATTFFLLQAGARVAALDRDETGLNATISEGKGLGDVRPYLHDLTDLDAIGPLVDTIHKDFGEINILINAAGIICNMARIWDIDLDNWRFTHDVNLTAPMLLTKFVSRHMIAQGNGGRIVNVASSSAFRPHSQIAYGSAKAGLVQLTRGCAGQLGDHNINVNCVAPGITMTNFTPRPEEESHRLASEGRLSNLLGRAATAADVAGPIVFLCLPESRQMTGQVVHTSAGAIV